MMDKSTVIERLKLFIDSRLESMSGSNPVISLVRPVVSRILKKKISDISSLLELLADENGMIDIKSIMGEMVESVMNTSPFTVNVPVLGDIRVGGGRIEVGIPYTDKIVVLGQNDLEELRDMLS